MKAAQSLETGGMAVFTAHFFSPISGKPRWDYVGTSPDTWKLGAGEYVPWVPLPWQLATAHESRSDGTVIGGFGSSKTIGLAAVSTFWCAQIPNFRFMDLAPVGWQAKQMFDAVRQDLVDYDNRFDNPRHITKLISKIVERPYPKITWYNGSTQEFMSADEQGAKILSWSGDAAVIDEADKLAMVTTTELDQLIINIGSRLRGQIGGRVRMGKLIVMANSGYDPELWARFDMAEAQPKHYFSILLKTTDNPYLTQKQVEAIERRIPDPAQRRQLMDAERPLPRGKEFTPEVLAKCQYPPLDDLMDHALQDALIGYEYEETQRAGCVLWALPPNEHDQYIIVGDPGQSPPPERNSGVIIVLKVTNFPKVPAELAAFWWGPTNQEHAGSYWPFVYQMEEWWRTYRPVYGGYDSTGVQKGFDELVFAQRGLILEGINLLSNKMRMVTSLKLILAKGLILMPNKVRNIWLQLANWHMPDTKLRQDIACTMFMAADILNRLFQLEELPERDPVEDTGPWVPDRESNRALFGERNQRLAAVRS